jgi:predicted DCC family thiol-disulfide oxidoreductase YuxK
MQRRVRPALHIQPWQRADLAALGWTVADASREVLWADAGGRRAGGARAVALALSTGCGGWPAVGAMLRLPPLSWLASAIYRLIARHRYRLPGGTPTCAAADRQPADPCDPARG